MSRAKHNSNDPLAGWEVPLETEEIQQAVLDIENRQRTNPLAWRGQFSPQLIEALFTAYAPVSPKILDPFLGSGTVLLEAALLGYAASGCEVNPAAYILATLHTLANVPLEARKSCVEGLNERLDGPLGGVSPPFGGVAESPEALKACLSNMATDANGLDRCMLEALVVLSDYHKKSFSVATVRKSWKKIVAHVLSLPFSTAPLRARLEDARRTSFGNGSFNFVVTSPPYINVFNYHQQYRASVETLEWDLLEVARSEIGSNRKHRQNRFLTVIQYCLDMAQVLCELDRMTSTDAYIIFVVGRESNVRGVPFQNSRLVCEVAERSNRYSLCKRQERAFTNRFGQVIYEDILHFNKTHRPDGGDTVEAARAIAGSVLDYVATQVNGDVRECIASARAKLTDVSPSPFASTNAEQQRRDWAALSA